MSESTRGVSIGLLIPEELPAPEAVDLAVSLEGAGFDTAWFTEIYRDPFVRCAATLARTQRLKVATGIAQWTRSPVTMAMTASELHEVSRGRFALGLGTGTAYSNERFHDIDFDRPARRMAEYATVVLGTWGAHHQPFSFHGEHFTVSDFRQAYFRDRPPLLLAAVGEHMLKLAARVADGVLLNPSTTPAHVREHVTHHLEIGAAQAGRSLEGFRRATCIRVAVDTDRATARERARKGIAEYGQYPVHQTQYASYGFGVESALIRDAMTSGDTRAAVAAVSDDMVDALALAGTPDEVRRSFGMWEGVVDSAAFMSPTFELAPEEIRANCLSVIDAFAT